jgi:transcriptional regulator with XRE-family HTH domain
VSPRPKRQSKLAQIRRWRGLTQEELAAATGVPLTTIYKLEAGKTWNPRVRHLRNLAFALDVPFDELLEDEWSEWTAFDARAGEPPDIDELLGVNRPGKPPF